MEIKRIFEDQRFFGDWRRGSGFKAEVILMKYTPFFYQEFFPRGVRRPGKDFEFAERQFEILFHYFLKRYTPKDNWQSKVVSAAVDFAKNFDAKVVLEEIESGEAFVDIKIPLDRVIFRIKRMGDSLGFQVRSGNGNDDIHEAGTKIMKESCYHDGNTGYWREFIKRVIFTIPVVKKELENKKAIIDLKNTILELNSHLGGIFKLKHCPDVPAELVEWYIAECVGKVFNGEMDGVQRWLKLVHLNSSLEEKDVSPQYRKGNISKVEGSPGVYEFMDGKKVFLQIGIDCMMEDTFCHDQIPIGINTAQRQRSLREWAMATHGQLYSMITSRRFNRS